MRSKEFITEKGPGGGAGGAGPGGGAGGAGTPGRGPGREMTDAQRAAQAAQGEENWQGIKNWWNNAPQTGGTAVPTAQDPAQVRGQGAAAAPVADVPLPQNQRTLRDPNSLNQANPAYAGFSPNQSFGPGAVADDSEARAAADAERNRKAITTTEPAPAPVKPAAVVPVPAAPVQDADPVPSFRVPGAAQAGQQGYNYTTGVAQDRPHRPDAGADQTTRNDYPFVPYTGPEPKPKPNVKPIPSPTPVPRRKVPKSVVQVSPDKQNLATTKTTLTPDEIKAAQEALRDPTIGPRDKAYYTELLKNQPASPATQAKPTGTSAYDGTQKFYRPSPSTNATPAVGSVVIKPGDTLSKIAAANGTTVPAIMALNPSITNADRIAAGQTVKLRESSEVARIRHLAGLSRN
jgi:LysM repeat protein